MFYKHQSVLLASKHEKEKAIAEAFFQQLSCSLCVRDFDTDQFGTFTGEIPRTLKPFDACVLKAKTAAKRFGFDLALASEGSFGPHPTLPFVASDLEIMVFVDLKNDWVIAEHLMTQKTNYSSMTVDPTTELHDFLHRVGFPDHALTLQTHRDKTLIAKGIQELDALNEALRRGFRVENQLFLATDMRAMMNPTRMAVIRDLAQQLAIRVATVCPACSVPGFGFKTTQGNLPCRLCDGPTSWYQNEVWACVRCSYEEQKSRKDGVLSAEPSYCQVCNP